MISIFNIFSLLMSFYVSDGDTIKEYKGSKERLRLIHIDAPESDQFFGDSSKIHLESLIKGGDCSYKTISIDRYNRPLIILYNKGQNINLKMVQDGYAWSYKFNKEQIYIDAMLEAKKLKKGLWKYEKQVDPYIWRKLKQ